MKQSISLIAILATMPALADDTRQLDAHEHGVGTLNIAIDGGTVAMEFHAPGADIVGFEYVAESDDDIAAIDAAIATLTAQIGLFDVSDAADCTVTNAHAALESEEHDDEDHDHSEHDHDDKHENDHSDAHEGHDHDDEHAEDDHKDDDHDTHEEHAKAAGHTEFHAIYTLTCNNPDALTQIEFGYFDQFPNAKEVEVQVITNSGAQAYEVMRNAPVLALGR